MDDADLDDLLRQSAPTPSAAAKDTAVLLARQSRGAHAGAAPPDRGRPVRRHRRWLVAGVAAGALTLTGAGTLTAYQLSVPPFQTLERGVGRTATGIPVIYTNSLDRTVKCLAFIEYRNLNASQRAALNQVVTSARWDGYGQRALDALDLPDASPQTQNVAITGVVEQDLWQAAHTAIPTMVFMQPRQDYDGPVFNGYSMSCANPGGVDGQP